MHTATARFKDLRAWLAHLEAKGLLKHVSVPIDKDWELAFITRQVMRQTPERRYALQFDNVKGFQTPVVTNSIGATREMYAMALGIPVVNGKIDKAAIHADWVQALAKRLPVK
ncbi:MAG TPA: hypothetical protein VJB15_10765, partial [Rhodothermia bacterium]|nr:hypothetical protein [Rhodothermia bacterium]